MSTFKNPKTGITGFAFIHNIKTFKSELEELTLDSIDTFIFNKKFTENQGNIQYYDKRGNLVEKNDGIYALYDTELVNGVTGDEILAYFERKKSDGTWSGMEFITREKFNDKVDENLKFKIGRIYFDSWEDGLEFLNDLSQHVIPEKWNYDNHYSVINHPILKSYIENVIEKIFNSNIEHYLLLSDDRKYAVFNTGLLSKFFHNVYLISTIDESKGTMFFKNTFIHTSLKDFQRIGFMYNGSILSKTSLLPKTVKFYNSISEIVFDPSLPIDRDFDRYTHIIEERIERFPEDLRKKDIGSLAKKLDDSIDYAVIIAERNYKLVVPQYRPQEDKIQLLMPIYLDGTYRAKPDFALILNLEDGIYTPETILPLDAAYQNARLIAKPDDFWLNPNDF